MKVCLLVEPSPITYICGYANRFQALLRHLHARGDQAVVVTTEVVVVDKPDSFLGFPIAYTYGFRLPFYPLMSMSCDWTGKVIRTLLQWQPHVVHCSSPSFMLGSAILYARLLHPTPLVVSYHTHLPAYVGGDNSYVPQCISPLVQWGVWKWVRLMHSLADLVVVTSPQIQEEFQHYAKIHPEVWLKGIDTERFHHKYKNQVMRDQMTAGNSNDFLMVYIGRLGQEKRLIELRDILERMPNNTRLCIVGTGPQEGHLREYFANTKTVFLGQKTGNELSQAFASADVFVMPSDSETLGFVILESMASQVPVVAANAGGIPNLIQDGVTGYLIETSNIDKYVEQLMKLHTNKNLRLKMGQSAREETLRWSWDQSMATLRDEQYTLAQRNFYNRWERRLWRILTFQKNPAELAQ
jgi:sulfoquinovosyltransferase